MYCFLMYFCFMIIVTGSAGFIGSCLVNELNYLGYSNLILVDDFSNQIKNKNLKKTKFYKKIDRSHFIDWFNNNYKDISFLFHLGARTDTSELNVKIFKYLNLNYSKSLYDICVNYSIPFVYASSAATYGMGEFGFDDNHENISSLLPLNPYALYKNKFDKWILSNINRPPLYVGLKFFNVYGPNEYHKGRMASVIFHAYNQIMQSGQMKLFKSHIKNFSNGDQSRDFIYVKDVVKTLIFFLKNQNNSGIYNLGTGESSSFNDLISITFKALKKECSISYIDIPSDIRDTYQYYTRAKISKLRSIGCKEKFYSLEDGVTEYVQEYLIEKKYY